MYDNKKNYIDEAIKLIDLIDERKLDKKEDYLFFRSIKSKIAIYTFISEKQIFWLRDIKDRQLENAEDYSLDERDTLGLDD